VALTEDTRLAGWGRCDTHQCDVPAWREFIAVAGGGWHGLALATVVCPEHPAMDFNRDCKVDLLDLAIFLDSWLDCNLDPPAACNY
jgi:hypothetical protein